MNYRNLKLIIIKNKNLLLNFLLFLSVFMSFILFVFSIVWSEKTNNVSQQKKFNIVLNFKNSYADRGYSQQSIEGVCESFDVVLKPLGNDKCDGTNENFKKGTISYGYPGTMENPLIIEKYVDNFNDINNFVFAGFTYNTFLKKKYTHLNGKWNDKNFLTIDTNFRTQNNELWPSRLYQIEIKQFLAGYHAALYSGYYALKNPQKFIDTEPLKEGKQINFGALGGLLILPIINYSIGFKYGLKIINENRTILGLSNINEVKFKKYQTIGGFDASQWSEKTKELAKQMYREKISVIFSIATSLTKEIHLAAQEMDKDQSNEKHWVIGVDIDQGMVLLNELENNDILNGKIIVSAILDIRKMVKKVIIDKQLKTDHPIDATKPIIFDDVNNGEGMITIPQRFLDNQIWSQITESLGEKINLTSKTLKKLEIIANKITKQKFSSQQLYDQNLSEFEFIDN